MKQQFHPVKVIAILRRRCEAVIKGRLILFQTLSAEQARSLP